MALVSPDDPQSYDYTDASSTTDIAARGIAKVARQISPHVGADAVAPHAAYDRAARILNFVLAGAILLLLSPLWLLIAVAIRVSSPGPIFYTRTVIGRGAQPFKYYKFRTMTQDNDDSAHRAFLESYVKLNKPFAIERDPVTGQERAVFKVVGDPRVTGVGRVLRRLSLDEIPQLFNVLRGEMNIVGPRPPIEFEFEMYDASTMERLNVRPGLTGLAQVSGRGRLTFAEMVALDITYVRERSLLLDLRIMLLTVLVMCKGA